MAKLKIANDDMAKLQQLETENAILKQKIADQEALRESMAKISHPDLSSEMRKIQRAARGSVNTITVKEKNDHRNIMLWTKDGQPIGPLHPDNAIQTLNAWGSRGIYLTVDRPTQAQIEAYCKTFEFKEMQRKETERRERKQKSKRKGNMEKLTAEIAKQTGIMANFIMDKAEVKQR